jgi:hypothetical protein
VAGELRATDHGGSDSSRPATPDDHGGSGSHPAAAQNCGERQTAPPTSSHPWPAAERAPRGDGEAELPSDGNERPFQGNASDGSAGVAPTSSAPRRWGARRTPAYPTPQRTLGHGGGDPVPPDRAVVVEEGQRLAAGLGDLGWPQPRSRARPWRARC